tara:strand:- start:2763 stop:3458 length:696 start_codon:yes stop_codon:yes gene_type:complete
MKIISFANSKFKRIALNWAEHLKLLNISDYVVYSLDDICHDFLTSHRVNTQRCVSSALEDNKFDFRTRLEIIFELLNSGQDILHSDLDALWLKDPSELVAGDYDIVASTGTFPPAIYQKIGFTLCKGWMYYKSNTAVKDIFKRVNRRPIHLRHDQELFNKVLFDTDLQYKISDIDSNIKEVQFNEFKIKVLDQELISRDKPRCNNTYVCHPLSPTSIDRERFLKEENLWVV